MFQPLLNRMPISRRRVLSGLAAGFASALLMLHAAPAHAADNSQAATQLVEEAGNQLVLAINTNESGSKRTAQLQQIIDNAVDVDSVARFCLGRYVHSASPKQLADYLSLFHRIMAVDISSKVGEYRGVTFKVLRSEPQDNGIAVSTLITRPNNAPNVVKWIVSAQSGQPKIVDLIAEGTSLRLTQRSDYASFLARNNNDVGALVAGMRRQAGG